MLFYQRALEVLSHEQWRIRGMSDWNYTYRIQHQAHMQALGALLRENHRLTSEQMTDLRACLERLPLSPLYRHDNPPPILRGLRWEQPLLDFVMLDRAECVLICFQEKHPESYLAKLWDSVAPVQAAVRRNPLAYAGIFSEYPEAFHNQIDLNHPNLLIRYSGLKFQWIKDAIAAHQEV